MIQTNLGATGLVSLGIAHEAVAGCIEFQVIPNAGGWSGSAVPKIRMGGALLSGGPVPAANLQTTRYWNQATSVLIAAGTPITSAGIYCVNAPGLEVALDYTHTSGNANVYAKPLEFMNPNA